MAFLAAAAALASALQASQPSPSGFWINPGNTVIVEIAVCGESALCGFVRWASDEAKEDVRAAGSAPLVGSELFHQFVVSGNGQWRGRVYVPDLQKAHKAELRLIDSERIEVRGCAVGRLICKAQVWTRTEPRQ